MSASPKRVRLYDGRKYVESIGLSMELLARRLRIVSDEPSDYILCWKRPPEDVDPSKVVLFQTEPPIASAVTETYRSSAQYAAFYCFDPDSVESGLSITSDALCYPYLPAAHKRLQVKSDYSGEVRFYFAGKKGSSSAWKVPLRFGARCIYQLRYQIASRLFESYPNSLVVGEGFTSSTKDSGSGWRNEKYNDLLNCDATFMFCCENSILRNYVSEKIHDGFNAGVPFVYLGAPNIRDMVPADCFIDATRFFDGGAFDHAGLHGYLESIGEIEYTRMCTAAREFSADFNARHIAARDELTARVCDLVLAG